MTFLIPFTGFNFNKMLSYRRETALQGTLLLTESGRLELGDNISLTLYVCLQPL